MPDHFRIEELVQPLSRISEIIFKRLHCMECNQCEPCGEVFMKALKQIQQLGGKSLGEGQNPGVARK